MACGLSVPLPVSGQGIHIASGTWAAKALATDAGANDCIFYDDHYQIYTNKDEIYDVKNIMEKKISNFISTEIEWVPINKIKLNQEDKEKLIKFLEILEENDDVQNIFTNAI